MLTNTEDLHKLIHCLLNKETKSFIFVDWLRWNGRSIESWVDKPERLQKVLEEISIRSPQMEIIKVVHISGSKYCQVDLTQAQPMLNLKILVLERSWTWSDNTLRLLAQKCPNLENLEVRYFANLKHF